MAGQGPIATVVAHVREAHATEKTPNFEDEEELSKFVRANRWVSMNVGNVRLFRFNWVTSLLAACVLWSFTIAALVDDEKTGEEWAEWQSWISQNFTWLYIGTQNIWAAFLIYLFFSRFGKIKLGKDHEKPEFGDLAWFAMLFCCGIGVGIYYWGVSEPMYYYRSPASWGSNKLWKTPINSDDDRANQAIFMTFFHWGLHGFVVYIVVALALGVVCYRWNMPLTMRSAFYPLLGNLIYSTVGDVIDALSIACTTFGVCTSLGFGVTSILAVISRLDDGETDADDEDNKVAVIWVITVAATASIVAGLKRGIQSLSIVTFLIGGFLVLALLYMDNTWYILNVFTQSIGYYMQWVVQVGWDCDAWQQLGYEFDGGVGNRLWGDSGSELTKRIVKATGQAMGTQAEYYDSHAKQFMEWWTVFYWGWWISWAPFVGMFIAKVSRGRTVRQVIMGAFLAPTCFAFIWLTVFGSLGIKMQRTTELALNVKPDYMDGTIDCAAMGYSGGQLIPQGTDGYNAKAHELADEGYYPIACRNHADRLMDIMEPYEGMTTFFWVLCLIGVSLYFVTSSDSGSYVDDIIAAQGHGDPPVLQRIFWAFTEGACACGLIVAGDGNSALSALQAASISAGLPYTLAICFLCTSLYRALKIDAGDEDICASGEFTTQLFDFADLWDYKDVGARFQNLALCLFAPFVGVSKAVKSVCEGAWVTVHSLASFALFLSWVVLMLCSANGNANLAYLGWVFYTFMALHLTDIRGRFRTKHGIYGSILEDFFACLTMYPWVVDQIQHQAENAPAPEKSPITTA